MLGREPSAAATASRADCSCGCSESDALEYVEPASEGDRVCAVKDVSATGRVEDWDVKTWLVLTVRTGCIAEPYAGCPVSNHNGGSLIIPECIHDCSRLRHASHSARKWHRRHQMLHVLQRGGINLRLHVGNDHYPASVGAERSDGGGKGVCVQQHDLGMEQRCQVVAGKQTNRCHIVERDETIAMIVDDDG